MLSTILRVLTKVLVAGAAWLITLFVVLFVGSSLGLADAGEVPSAAYSLSAVFVPIIVAILSILPKSKKSTSSTETTNAPAAPQTQDPVPHTEDLTPSLDFAFLPLPEVPSQHNSATSRTVLRKENAAPVSALLPPISVSLFPPKISERQLECVRGRLNQLHDTEQLIYSTVNPDIFFKRLNFALDILLDLRNYEKYGIFKENSPTSDYNEIIQNMEVIVDSFIDRSIEANRQKLLALKTSGAKKSNYEKFVIALIAAFDCANTFWSGSKGYPHYSGPLYTENNYRRAQALFEDLDNLD